MARSRTPFRYPDTIRSLVLSIGNPADGRTRFDLLCGRGGSIEAIYRRRDRGIDPADSENLRASSTGRRAASRLPPPAVV